MSRRDDERVADILETASQISELIELGRDAWDKDRIRQLAMERLLEIIGEAANSLSEEFRAQHPGIPWRTSTSLQIADYFLVKGTDLQAPYARRTFIATLLAAGHQIKSPQFV